MQIGGWVKSSLIDYPGKVATVIFTQGCNFRCPYCHNPELVSFRAGDAQLSEETVLGFLKQRKGQIEGVVITGGEPTLQKDLVSFLGKIEEIGFYIKVDTNGSNPLVLQELISSRLVNYIAMDVKASWKNYERATGVKINVDSLKESIDLILHSGLPYQFRTTLVKPIHSPEEISEIHSAIKNANHYILQEFIPDNKILDPQLSQKEQFTSEQWDDLKSRWQKVTS